jgi:hypothetical protein
LSVGRSGARIEIINASPSAHAASMLIAWVPSERLLFQGDLLRVNDEGGAASSPGATQDLRDIIQRLKLNYATIGAVHGRVIKASEAEELFARALRPAAEPR